MPLKFALSKFFLNEGGKTNMGWNTDFYPKNDLT